MFGDLLASLSVRARRIVALVGVVFVASLVLTIILTRGGSGGGLIVTTSSASAEIYISQLAGEQELLGVGSVQTSVASGVYDVVVTDGDKQTRAAANITKGQTTRLDIKLHDLAPIKRIGGDAATNIIERDGTLYYLNTTENTPFSFRIGSATGRPYMSGLGAVTELFWLTPTSFYSRNALASWSYVEDTTASLVTKNTNPISNASVSFNRLGGVTYVTEDSKVMRADRPSEPPTQIGDSAIVFNPYTAVADDGSVVLFSPILADDDPLEPVTLFSGDQTIDITELTGTINTAAWSPDSKRFAYSTTTGFFVFDTESKTTSRAVLLEPSHAQSITWVGDTNMLFVQNDAVWNYDLAMQQAYKVATIAGVSVGRYVATIAADGQTVYMGSAQNEGIYQFIPNFALLGETKQAELQNTLDAVPAFTPTTFAGFDALLDRGVTSSQQAKLLYALGEFKAQTSPAFTSATVVSDSIRSLESGIDSPERILRLGFNLRLNNRIVYAELDYTGLRYAKVSIFESLGGDELFNSGEITELKTFVPTYDEVVTQDNSIDRGAID